MRFRLHKIGIVADIEKSFLQVGLQPLERDVTRFLWLKDISTSIVNEDNIQEFRFARVPFWRNFESISTGATIECHLDSYESEISEILKNDIYVDNVITGTETETEAIKFYETSKSIFKDASMNLREWTTNSKSVNTSIPTEDRSGCEKTKVLGHYWNVKDDTFSIKAPMLLPETSQITKRTVLKQIASVYDPLGLFCPILLRGKIPLQSLWSKHCDWDDELENSDILSWKSIKEDFVNIPNSQIPRYVGLQVVDENTKVQNRLVCFCDASKYAYACCIYLIQGDKNVTKGNLVFAKSRLAPIKQNKDDSKIRITGDGHRSSLH
ncbi:uncharacterized protein LOC128554283 [Mercenaria mercenaria]|uniref:uncharacterized protein LOC128554283 n=1 Tax=Mercenaria mercenaria TaxID=6596 RepID=UPI00234FB1F5|nr:uncharacterized protein LOC128554283 [Mercenaria mercenaria]